MRVPSQHRLYAVAYDLGEVSVVDSSSSEMGDAAMTALLGANVQARGLLGWLPKVTVEGALAPEAATGRREEEMAVGAVEVDLGFEHPGEGGGDGDEAAGVGLTVVGLRSLEDLALVSGAADLERLAFEVLAAQGQDLP